MLNKTHVMFVVGNSVDAVTYPDGDDVERQP